MAEKTMKEQRDEIALRLFTEWMVAAFQQPTRPVDLPRMAEHSFRCAEAWMAARYDADQGKLKP